MKIAIIISSTRLLATSRHSTAVCVNQWRR